MGETTRTAPPAVESGEVERPSVPTIPKPRFDQVIGENHALKAAVSERDTTVAELRAELDRERASKAPPAEPKATPKAETPPVTAPPQSYERRMAILELRAEHPGLSPKAADSVLAYQEKGLSTDDALELTRKRLPGEFGEDRRGFDSATHSVSPPSNGPPPAKPPEPTVTDRINAMRARGDLHGAQALAQEHARNLIKAKIPGRTP